MFSNLELHILHSVASGRILSMAFNGMGNSVRRMR